MIDFCHESDVLFTETLHVLFFDWLTVNASVVYAAVCCGLHWTRAKAGQKWEVCFFIGKGLVL